MHFIFQYDWWSRTTWDRIVSLLVRSLATLTDLLARCARVLALIRRMTLATPLLTIQPFQHPRSSCMIDPQSVQGLVRSSRSRNSPQSTSNCGMRRSLFYLAFSDAAVIKCDADLYLHWIHLTRTPILCCLLFTWFARTAR